METCLDMFIRAAKEGKDCDGMPAYIVRCIYDDFRARIAELKGHEHNGGGSEWLRLHSEGRGQITNGNDPVSPIFDNHGILILPCLTKRELFAAMAMQGMLSANSKTTAEQYAVFAVVYADALIAALSRPTEATPLCADEGDER